MKTAKAADLVCQAHVDSMLADLILAQIPESTKSSASGTTDDPRPIARAVSWAMLQKTLKDMWPVDIAETSGQMAPWADRRRQDGSSRDLSVDASASPRPWSVEAHIGKEPGGKPFLEDWPDLHISVSRTSADGRIAAMCCASASMVGCDVEAISRFENPPESFSKRFPTGRARKVRDALPEQLHAEYTCVLWTAVEAFAKMTGEGLGRNVLATDLSEVLRAASEADGAEPVSANSQGCWFTTWAREGFRFCICASEPVEIDLNYMQTPEDALLDRGSLGS